MNDYDAYYDRNKKENSSCFIEYLIDILPKKDLMNFDIAELGTGNGADLFLLKNYTSKQCHGYEASEEAVKSIKNQISVHPQKDNLDIQNVVLPNEFKNPIKYDLVIFGFLVYFMNNDKLSKLKKNILDILRGKGSYIYVYDFLTREERSKKDIHNPDKEIYKRPFEYWLKYFDAFDLIDFRLFDDKFLENKLIDNLSIIKEDLPYDDDKWTFSALFRKK